MVYESFAAGLAKHPFNGAAHRASLIRILIPLLRHTIIGKVQTCSLTEQAPEREHVTACLHCNSLGSALQLEAYCTLRAVRAYRPVASLSCAGTDLEGERTR